MTISSARPRPPVIARDTWARHPRFPRQTLLLRSHRSFLEISEALIAAAAADAPLAEVEASYRRWIWAMRGHEAYEEDKLYPYLARRWDLSFHAAQEGHEALHDAHDEVIAAFALRGRDDVRAALERHHAVLVAHLELEEELVIPALLALSPREFDRYYDSDLPTLIAQLERTAAP